MEKYTIDDLLKAAKRENNKKRSYLYVNPLQGKHMPVSPSVSVELFSLLARKVEERYENERLLIIGFAETATAIGSMIAYAASNVKFYMSTTRESIPEAGYLFFTESHSHATEQRLVVNELKDCLMMVDRIVFAEDEVTTGNTIEKLINGIREKFPEDYRKFGIVSILNSMSDSRIRELEMQGIICDYVHHIPVRHKINEIDRFVYEPSRNMAVDETVQISRIISIGNYWNSRIVSSVDVMRKCCNDFVAAGRKQIGKLCGKEKILVLGTEECMFPGMLLGKEIEADYPESTVRFHATTRSPIEVSQDADYPLNHRDELDSLYEAGRKTFIYNLQRYDRVLVVTDAQDVNIQGLNSLITALKRQGNDEISLIRWGDQSDEE